MSFPDHPPPPPPPPPPFLPPPPSAKGNFWRKNGVDKDDEDSNPQAFKRPRNLINPQSNPSNFPRMNPPNPLLNRGTGYIFYKTRMCLKFLDGNCRNGDQCTFAHGADDLREPPPNWQEIVGRKENTNGFDEQRTIHRFKICKKYANGEECPYGENCNFLHKRVTSSFDDMDGPRESSAIRIGTNGPMMNVPVMNVPVMNVPVMNVPVMNVPVMNVPVTNVPVTNVPVMNVPAMNVPVMGIRSGPNQIDVVDNIENKHVAPGSDAFCVNMKPAYWRTKLCSKWEITGQCPFGERCHFAHGQADLQLPGVRIEAEAVSMLSSIAATKPVFIPPTTTTDVNTALVAPTTDENRVKKYWEKWKGPKKMNNIYADWIDDLSPPLMYPKKTDT